MHEEAEEVEIAKRVARALRGRMCRYCAAGDHLLAGSDGPCVCGGWHAEYGSEGCDCRAGVGVGGQSSGAEWGIGLPFETIVAIEGLRAALQDAKEHEEPK